MYDVIYFNAWSDIICTAAKLLHGTSASLSPRGQRPENVWVCGVALKTIYFSL